MSFNPPPVGISTEEIRASVVHKIGNLYKIIYLNSKKLNKADKLGLRSKTEQICLNCLHLSVTAALLSTDKKLPLAEKLKIEIEMLKQLIRLENEIKIIDDKTYINWQENLQEISKMTVGWIKYLQQKGT